MGARAVGTRYAGGPAHPQTVSDQVLRPRLRGILLELPVKFCYGNGPVVIRQSRNFQCPGLRAFLNPGHGRGQKSGTRSDLRNVRGVGSVGAGWRGPACGNVVILCGGRARVKVFLDTSHSAGTSEEKAYPPRHGFRLLVLLHVADQIQVRGVGRRLLLAERRRESLGW